jgi:FAD/FMN-containing dehydrogenase
MTDQRPPDAATVRALADDLEKRLGSDAVSVDEAVRRAASTDWAFMSPILSARLPAGLADIVVTPRDIDGIRQAVALARRHRVPITARGKGTGNYGQAIPLCNGLVIDLERCEAVLEVGDGWMRTQPGAKFVVLEQLARRHGQELIQVPSTVGSTVAGYVAGGSGGAGSIETGWNWEGFVRALDVVPCTDDAQPVHLEGDDTRPLVHAYGTTGVIGEVTVALVPARTWTALFASFAHTADAIAAGLTIMAMERKPRLVSVDEPAVVAEFAPDPAIPAGRASLRAIVEEAVVGDVERVVADAAGTVEAVRPKAPGYLTSLSFNHVTHRVLKARPGFCHLQVAGEGLTERTDELKDVFPETLVHLDGFKVQGRPGFVGILMCPFEGRERLDQGIRDLGDLGVRVNDPHHWTLDRNLPVYWEAAERFDPDGLLNPGKLPPRRHR